MATTTQQVTPEQLQACHRHIDENGKPYYTVDSASEPGSFYTVRWNPQYKVPQDNCKAGREGNCCWHKRAVLVAERQYQDMKRADRIVQAQIEATPEYQAEQREHTLYTAEQAAAQERNLTTQCSDGSYW